MIKTISLYEAYMYRVPHSPSIALTFALMALACPGFADDTPLGDSAETKSYRMICASEAFDVTFAGEAAGETLVISTGNDTYTLPHVPSADGAKFATDDESTLVWVKGSAAMVTLNGMPLTDCRLEPLTAPWSAQGNEPGWRVQLTGERILFDLNYGEDRLDLRQPDPVQDGARTIYAIPAFALTLTRQDKMCYDDMSGRPYPQTVTLTTATAEFRGCGGDTMALLQGDWQVKDHAGHPPLAAHPITLAITDSGQLSGSTGCNRFAGQMSITGEGQVIIGPLATTRMACAMDAMQQEHDFLATLATVDRFDIDEAGDLVLMHGNEVVIIAGR